MQPAARVSGNDYTVRSPSDQVSLKNRMPFGRIMMVTPSKVTDAADSLKELIDHIEEEFPEKKIYKL